MDDLSALNTPEPKIARIQRLAREATRGAVCNVSIIDAVEFRREQYGLRAVAFAAILGMHASHYSEFVHGKRALPVSAMRRAYAIGVPADALLQHPASEQAGG